LISDSLNVAHLLFLQPSKKQEGFVYSLSFLPSSPSLGTTALHSLIDKLVKPHKQTRRNRRHNSKLKQQRQKSGSKER